MAKYTAYTYYKSKINNIKLLWFTLNPNVVFWKSVVATTNTISDEIMEMYSKL